MWTTLADLSRAGPRTGEIAEADISVGSGACVRGSEFTDDALGRPAITVGSGNGPVRRLRGGDCFADGLGSSARDTVGAQFDGFGPFGTIAESDARNAEIEGFLLNAAGVRENFDGVFFSSEHFEITEGDDRPEFAVQGDACRTENLLGARMNGEKNGQVQRAGGLQNGV